MASTENKDANATAKPGTWRSITNFESSPTLSPGFTVKTDLNLKLLLSKRVQKPLDFGLCKPAIWGDFAIVGTDVADSKHNYLICFNWETMVKDAREDPTTSYLRIPENVTGLHWIAEDVVLASLGHGNVRLYSVSSDRKTLELAGIFDRIHDNSIREVAMCPTNGNQFASGGSDKKLRVTDLTVGTEPVDSVSLNGVVGSIRWPALNQGFCPSSTMDSGVFLLFDVRQGLKKSALDINLHKQELWAHERYTDHHLLLGFGNGEIYHLDLRKPTEILHAFNDPYVEGVGNIEYNSASSSFTVSGLSDFTVWKQQAKTDVARVWSHSVSGADIFNKPTISMTATYINPTDILTASSTGHVGVFLQDFGM